jgi:hypothetical protein
MPLDRVAERSYKPSLAIEMVGEGVCALSLLISLGLGELGQDVKRTSKPAYIPGDTPADRSISSAVLASGAPELRPCGPSDIRAGNGHGCDVCSDFGRVKGQGKALGARGVTDSER